MKKIRTTRGWCPTIQQELVLRAALSSGSEEVLSAWRQLKRGDSLTLLDEGSSRLLPLLYHNLCLHHMDEPLMGVLEEEYVRTWCNNQLLFHGASDLLRIFQVEGIESILLKGAALALHVYKDGGLRPMSDIDILVRPQDAGLAIKLLGEGGWESSYKSPEALIPYEQAVEFRNGLGVRCDLHWKLLLDGRQEIDDEDFWEGAHTVEINDVRTKVLSPTDQLLHVCVHGAEWNDMPPVRWVADAAMILRTSESEIDWERLIEQVRKRRLMLPMRDTLGYLQEQMGVPVPPEALKTIRQIPSTYVERTLYQIRVGPDKPLKRIPVLHYWVNAWRLSRVSPFHRKLMEFLSYLKCLWGVERFWQAPFYLAFKSVRGIAQILLAPRVVKTEADEILSHDFESN